MSVEEQIQVLAKEITLCKTNVGTQVLIEAITTIRKRDESTLKLNVMYDNPGDYHIIGDTNPNLRIT